MNGGLLAIASAVTFVTVVLGAVIWIYTPWYRLRRKKPAPPNPLLEWHMARRAMREARLNEWSVEYRNALRLVEPEPIVIPERATTKRGIRPPRGRAGDSGAYGAWDHATYRHFKQGEVYSCHDDDLVTYQPDGSIIVSCWHTNDNSPRSTGWTK